MQVSAYLKLSVAVAVATIALKTAAWWVTGSVSLLSDALESLVNLAGAVFALLMVTIAAQPADDDHPYGHHKAEYFSSGFEGVLILVAALAIIWAAVQRFWSPQPLESLGWGLGLSIVSSAMNAALAWAMLKKAREHRSMALEGDARHLFTDVWTSAGVVLGLLAVSATGWLWLDPVIALLVGLWGAARKGLIDDTALLKSAEFEPPVTRTVPSGNSVALACRRANAIGLVQRHCGAVALRSITSAVAVGPAPEAPPAVMILLSSYCTATP